MLIRVKVIKYQKREKEKKRKRENEYCLHNAGINKISPGFNTHSTGCVLANRGNSFKSGLSISNTGDDEPSTYKLATSLGGNNTTLFLPVI